MLVKLMHAGMIVEEIVFNGCFKTPCSNASNFFGKVLVINKNDIE